MWTAYVFAQDRETAVRCGVSVSCTGDDCISGCAGCYKDILKRSEELGLTDKQKERIQRLESDSAGKLTRMTFDAKKAEERLRSLVCGSTDDLPAIRAEIEKAAKNWGDLRYACIRNMVEVRRVLGEEKWNAWLKTAAYSPLAGFDAQSIPDCRGCTGFVDDDSDDACDRRADCSGHSRNWDRQNIKACYNRCN